MNKKSEIHARIPPVLMANLQEFCERNNCNLSDVTRFALILFNHLQHFDDCELRLRHRLCKLGGGDIGVIPKECYEIPPTSEIHDADFLKDDSSVTIARHGELGEQQAGENTNSNFSTPETSSENEELPLPLDLEDDDFIDW